MDNLTHSLVGALLGRTRLPRATPHAVALCVIAANAPDLDLVAGLTPAAYLRWHRHWTHSVLAVPVMAFTAIVLTRAWAWSVAAFRKRKPSPIKIRSAWAPALVAAATHPLLDLTNSYGVRLWLPFSGAWASWDTLFIIDPLVWAMLAAALLVGSVRWRGGAAWAGLAALCLYVGFSAVERARIVQEMRAGFDGSIERAAVFPAPGLGAWSGYIESGSRALSVPLRSNEPVDWSRAQAFSTNVEEAAVGRAWKTELGRAYRGFARYPFAEVRETDGAVEVTLADFRFLRFGRVGFACVVRVGEGGAVLGERFAF